jgi:hypothetical protein
MHRDLHAGNIMIKLNPNKSKIVTLYDGIKLYNQDYIAVLIDFANIYVKIDIGRRDEKMIINSDALNMYGSGYDCEYKRDYDMRLFLSSLYMFEIDNLDTVLNCFFQTKKMVQFEEENYNDVKYFSYYDALHRNDTEFYPENIIQYFLLLL